ncbi:L-2-amino-thiazoline-4-carboxylic acid hydrolase [Marinifilum caeruleilacunae]|uniref:L-2-amino-thiazoline-4-carboxylic acid hydrolase n=1 Tax=Marinifilum caeruleilacunae TaxID=2499076 RepID=A0ABX1WU99_9BACT|nr:L-2-amino-thiazoline-4-carboxylic acid hydrolase [Marinifilum caeruleilacunae]NOU59683.1 hypothetical protein [Marinifilum caeruleilacunae]
MKVQELKLYGKALEMPRKALRKQKKVIFHLLRKEFGLIGVFSIALSVKKHSRRIEFEYPEVMVKANEISAVIAKELIFLGALFYALADKRGRLFAKKFMTSMIQKMAMVSMPCLYELNDLVKCEGDVFDNFKKYNRAMFTEIDRVGSWKNSGFNETDDLLEFKVISCLNIELFEGIECPELNTLGCEHDLAGYPLIEQAVQCEFRRSCTLAKGGEYCHFQFYRKGTAPKTTYLNQ